MNFKKYLEVAKTITYNILGFGAVAFTCMAFFLMFVRESGNYNDCKKWFGEDAAKEMVAEKHRLDSLRQVKKRLRCK